MTGLGRRSLSLTFAAAGCCATLALGACQLIGGIGDIALVPDGGLLDVNDKVDGHTHHGDGAAGDVTVREGSTKGDDGGHETGLGHDGAMPGRDTSTGGDAGPPHRDAAPPPRDAAPGGTPCRMGGTCFPSGSVAEQDYCADGGIEQCGQMNQACCPGNANGAGTTGDFCGGDFPGMQSLCGGGACGQCGQTGAACCPATQQQGLFGNQICENQAVCVGGVCLQCGSNGEPCCNEELGNACQGTNLSCDPTTGVCTSCTCNAGECCDGASCIADGALCSSGQTCNGSNSCDQGLTTPRPCGVAGQPCCSASPMQALCVDGSQCVASMCTACGGNGQPCCIDANSHKGCNSGLGANLVCDNAGATCTACGGAGQPCCPGDSCTAGACDPTSNVCNPDLGCAIGCGGLGQTCCVGSSCSPGMCCDDTTTTLSCVADGAKCANGYLCVGSTCTCGGSGQPCCETAPKCDFDGGTCKTATKTCS